MMNCDSTKMDGWDLAVRCCPFFGRLSASTMILRRPGRADSFQGFRAARYPESRITCVAMMVSSRLLGGRASWERAGHMVLILPG